MPPFELDIVGELDPAWDERASRSPQDTLTKQLLLPVGVKADRAPMIAQTVTYARRKFAASSSRQAEFAVVLGFQYVEGELRFLVFHRSGLTGSLPCSAKNESGQKDIIRVFLSILDWRSAEHAGFLGFYNDVEMSLLRYDGDETGVVARVKEVLHDNFRVQGRASRALLMFYPTGEGKDSEPALGPAVRARQGAKTRTEQGDGEARTSLYYRHICASACKPLNIRILPPAVDLTVSPRSALPRRCWSGLPPLTLTSPTVITLPWW